MKGVLCACLLAALQSMSPARAYEADIHYSTTYVLARAVGWSEADALIIASVNQGVDENPDTVAALEVDRTSITSVTGFVTSSLRQAEKNLRFHCFSTSQVEAGKIAADVRKIVSGHFGAVPEHHDDPRRNTRRLIALGVALHCQQDAHSHSGFGGSCGRHAGSCYGHSHRTFFDQLAFRLLGKHYFDPDHPGVSGERLFAALRETANELAAHLPASSRRPLPPHQVAALSDALRASGIELDDRVRRDCNRYIAGKWLLTVFRSSSVTRSGAEAVEKLSPQIAGTCRNASFAAATVARIPDPRFPRLNADASPYLVRADGTYQQILDESSGVSLQAIANYRTHQTKVQLSNWKQLLALTLTAQVASSSATPIEPSHPHYKWE